MAVANFEGLCASFCELISVPTPTLAEDAVGRVGFHVIQRGITVNIVHCPHACPDYLFVRFDFCTGGPDGVDHAEMARSLLDANFGPLEIHPPVFSRNPENGDIVLQYVCNLFDTSAHRLLELMDAGISAAERWRKRDEKQSDPIVQALPTRHRSNELANLA